MASLHALAQCRDAQDKGLEAAAAAVGAEVVEGVDEANLEARSLPFLPVFSSSFSFLLLFFVILLALSSFCLSCRAHSLYDLGSIGTGSWTLIPDASPSALIRCSFSFASVTHTLLFKYGHLSKINGKPTYLHISTHGSHSCPEVAVFDLLVAELVIRSFIVTGF